MGKHEIDRDILGLHQRPGGTKGRGCLNRHITGVTKSLCSHRYQARERAANEDKSWYNWKAYESLATPGVYDTTKVKHWNTIFMASPDGQISFAKPRPTAHSWDVVGENFMSQAHHIIPNRVLNGCIVDTAKLAKSYSLYKLVRGGMLKAEYNLNDKINMILLPMEKEVSIALKLPKHLATRARAHKFYSIKVKSKVEKIIGKYAKACADNSEDHKESPVNFSKSALESISAKMRNALRAFGELEAGRCLNKMSWNFLKKYYK